MSTFGDNLIQAMTEALAHAKGEGPAVVHAPIAPREVREQAKLTQAQMAPLMGMSLSGYRKWEQGQRRVSGPAATLLRLIQKEPDVVKRAAVVGLPLDIRSKTRCSDVSHKTIINNNFHMLKPNASKCRPVFWHSGRCNIWQCILRSNRRDNNLPRSRCAPGNTGRSVCGGSEDGNSRL